MAEADACKTNINSSPADQHRQKLLDGIDVLPQLGIPGRVVVYGEDAVPVLCGVKEEDVLVACAEFGKGRVVVLGHDGYLVDIIGSFQEEFVAKFQANMKQWVARKNDVTDSEICVLRHESSPDDIRKCSILVWSGGNVQENMLQAVIRFVMSGGGFIYGMTPWGWLQLNKGKQLSDMPLYSLLELLGICYTDEYMGDNRRGFNIEESLLKKGGFHVDSVGSQKALMDILPNSKLEYSELMGNNYRARKWRLELLEGVTSLRKIGVPGKVIVFGEHAHPILSGDQAGDVLLGAAKFGNGRIVLFSEERYLRGIAGSVGNPALRKVQSNVKDWVSRYTHQDSSDITLWNRRNMALDDDCKILVVHGVQHLEDSKQREIVHFIQKGGGFITGLCPWVWHMRNRGQKIQDLGFYPIVKMAGMSLTANAMHGNKEGFDVVGSLKNENGGLHLSEALDNFMDPGFPEQSSKALASLLSVLPNDVFLELEDKFQQISTKYAEEFQKCAPTGAEPVTQPKERAMVAMCEVLFRHGIGMKKAPGISAFPGDFDEPPQLHSTKLIFESQHKDFHPTGYYLPAGIEMRVHVKTMTGEEEWKLRIGSHTDKLYKKPELKRWPNICTTKPLSLEFETKVTSPFGGLVYFISPDGTARLEATLEGVVEAPCFDLRDPASVAEWNKRRQSPGLWADISGRLITITLPSESIRHLDAPVDVMETWDRVVMAHHDLRGTNPSDRRREFVVCDKQPSAGYMHSGHPLVTHLDVASPDKHRFLLDNNSLVKSGSWGVFHELGHNMQRKWWTFRGTGEVTCNIFSLHAMYVICGMDPWTRPAPNTLKKIEKYLKEGAQLAQWRSHPFIGFGIYIQLAHYFGWDAYKSVLREYENMDDKSALDEDQTKIDTWIRVFSRTVKCNLCPLFEFWGLPVSPEVKRDLVEYQAFLPEDKITSLDLDRLATVREKYIAQSLAGAVAQVQTMFQETQIFVSEAQLPGITVLHQGDESEDDDFELNQCG